jgi:hypothetical protein
MPAALRSAFLVEHLHEDLQCGGFFVLAVGIASFDTAKIQAASSLTESPLVIDIMSISQIIACKISGVFCRLRRWKPLIPSVFWFQTIFFGLP